MKKPLTRWANQGLPSYSDERLAQLDAAALIDLLVADEDRVPRNVIDAAARLGEPMVVALQERLTVPWRETASDGEWWLRLHALMIVGLIANESAGLLLVELIRRMALADDVALQDWLAGSLPALFANKSASVIAPLRDLCTSAGVDWYYRTNAVDPVLAAALREAPAALDAALDWVAQIAADEEENWDMRLCCGDNLLDFPRERHRLLVDELARRQTTELCAHFTAEDVSRAYRAKRDEPSWLRHGDPWNFYAPKAIRRRQERWASEATDAAASNTDDSDHLHLTDDDGSTPWQPFVRHAPKVGRNDPCPCGSGKKYKKCHGA